CNTITTDITIPIGSAEEMAATAQQYVSAGFTALKLKAGNDELADIAAIKAVSAAVGPNVSIKVDANQAWTAAQTRRIMAQLQLPNLIALEQPLPDWQLMEAPALRQELAVPWILDESVHNAHDASAAVKHGATDLINIKLAKSGGFAGAN
ncbi:dipeptide epimerase, partial [Salmonella enterica subsp. enterica serovar Istanbul]|nr:dipeptide epimerase [Salmonella enterica subsp. enterica serovar Istanbul]